MGHCMVIDIGDVTSNDLSKLIEKVQDLGSPLTLEKETIIQCEAMAVGAVVEYKSIRWKPGTAQ
jgi:hypothetical protein